MKRGFNTKQSLEYLGVQRRFFENSLMPFLEGKGVRAGTSIIYEKTDLDDAWERYKLSRGSERASSEGSKKWFVQKEGKAASTSLKTVAGRSIANTENTAFAGVVSMITGQQKSS